MEVLNYENIVLNLIINGLPSIPKTFISKTTIIYHNVLNLIINGLPSIQHFDRISLKKFKFTKVLNLIINGLPSIH